MKCIACGVEDNQPKRFSYTPTTIDKLKIFDEREILYCGNCGFGMIEKDVNHSVLQTYYTSDYAGKAKKHVETRATDNRTNHSFDVRSLSQLALIKQYVDIDSDFTIVEIGAGTGDFLFSLKQIKFGGRYIAFEPQLQSHECLKNLGGEVEKCVFDYHNAAKFADSADLVIMSHSLEHFNPGDVREIVNSVAMILKKGGTFFCEVPNANLGLYPNAGERVVPHLSFFSIDSLKYLLTSSNMDILFLNACGSEQLKKDTKRKIQELDKKGCFVFDMDHENNILRNRKYHQYMEAESVRRRNRQRILNTCSRIFGRKLTMFAINVVRRCKQKPHSSLIGDSHFSYGPSREFIRLIAKKL